MLSNHFSIRKEHSLFVVEIRIECCDESFSTKHGLSYFISLSIALEQYVYLNLGLVFAYVQYFFCDMANRFQIPNSSKDKFK